MTAKTLVIGIGGASSSGKSTIAKLLHSITPGSFLLQQDDFFKPDKDIPIDEATGLENWDCPEALNLDAFTKEIQHLKLTGTSLDDNKEIKYTSDTMDQDLSSLSTEIISKVKSTLSPLFAGIKLIIVDGFMIFHDPDIIRLFDTSLFIQCSYDTLRQRRESRSGYQTQDSFWVDPPGYFDKIVYPSYAQSHKFLFINQDVEGTIDPKLSSSLHFNIIINNNGTPIDKALLSATEILQHELQNCN